MPAIAAAKAASSKRNHRRRKSLSAPNTRKGSSKANFPSPLGSSGNKHKKHSDDSGFITQLSQSPNKASTRKAPRKTPRRFVRVKKEEVGHEWIRAVGPAAVRGGARKDTATQWRSPNRLPAYDNSPFAMPLMPASIGIKAHSTPWWHRIPQETLLSSDRQVRSNHEGNKKLQHLKWRQEKSLANKLKMKQQHSTRWGTSYCPTK